MPSRYHLEPVEKGLQNARDPALMGEGGLLKAGNVRYRPADPSLWFAEGRVKLSGDHGTAPIQQMIPIEWDPGSTYIGTGEKGELYQLLYFDAGKIYVLPLRRDPTSSDLDSNNAPQLTWATPATLRLDGIDAYAPPVLNTGGILEAVAQTDTVGTSELTWFLLHGGEPIALVRDAQGEFLIRHGFPTTPSITSITPTGTGFTVANRIYEYWWTWYSRDLGIEGSTTARSSIVINPPNDGKNLLVEIPLGVRGTWPQGVDRIRIYRTDASIPLADEVGTGTDSSGSYPHGTLLREIVLTDMGGGFSETTGKFTYTDTGYVHGDVGYADDGRVDFPIVTIRLGGTGISTETGKNGPPPKATTGDVFEESLCLNDVDDARKMWFSYPGEPHAFPFTYWINFDTKESDRIIAIRSLGHALGVWMERSVWRVNWLPREADFSFNRGDVTNLVVSEFGAVSNRGVTKFQMPEVGPMAAWVSESGIHASNLYRWQPLTDHIDWEGMVSRENLSSAWLVNNPREYRLEFYYTPRGGEQVTRALYLHYHPTHLVGGIPKITGPHERPGGVAAVVLAGVSTGVTQIITSDEKRNLFYEGFGTRDESSGAFLGIDVETRDIYANGIGNEFKVLRGLAHVKASSFSSGFFRFVVKSFPSGREKFVDITGGERRLLTPRVLENAEYVRLKLVGGAQDEGASLAINLLGFQLDDLGKVER